MKADSLALRGLADEARPLYLEAASLELAPFATRALDRSGPEAVPILVSAASCYAAAGLHLRALALLDEIQAHPHLTPPWRTETERLRAEWEGAAERPAPNRKEGDRPPSGERPE